jgi:hypothetical protein
MLKDDDNCVLDFGKGKAVTKYNLLTCKKQALLQFMDPIKYKQLKHPPAAYYKLFGISLT